MRLGCKAALPGWPHDTAIGRGRPGRRRPRPLDRLPHVSLFPAGPYARRIAHLEEEIKRLAKHVHDTAQMHESSMGLAPPARWDVAADRQVLQEEPALQVRGGHLQAAAGAD